MRHQMAYRKRILCVYGRSFGILLPAYPERETNRPATMPAVAHANLAFCVRT